MSFYGSVSLSRMGGVFGAFGDGRVIFGPFKFTEAWSSDDFENPQQFVNWVKPFLDQVNRKDLTYDSPTPAILNKASTAWAQWLAAVDAGSATAQSYVDSITAQMKDLIARADALTLEGGGGNKGHRSEVSEVGRYDTFNLIVKIVKKVAGSASQATAALNAAVAAGVPPIETTSAGIPNDGAGTVNRSASGVPGDITSGANKYASTATGGDNTMLYVGLGVGALVLIGGVLYVRSKRSSPAVAGYRRRSRR